MQHTMHLCIYTTVQCTDNSTVYTVYDIYIYLGHFMVVAVFIDCIMHVVVSNTKYMFAVFLKIFRMFFFTNPKHRKLKPLTQLTC